MSTKKIAPEQNPAWVQPRRPFEIEVIVLLFVLVALVMPFYIGTTQTEPDPLPQTILAQARGPAAPSTTNFSNVVGMLWGVSILGLYLMHVTMGTSSMTYNTTPSYYLVAPLIFGGIAYYRMFQQQELYDLSAPLVSGSPGIVLLAFSGILLATCLLARMRMLRYRLLYRKIDWEMVLATRRDKTFWAQLAWQFRPLLYPPRRYLVCPDGILIEGWLYLRAVPMKIVEDVEHVGQFNSLLQAEIYAGSARDLLQINLSEQVQPVLISPRHHEQVLQYCRDKLGERLKVRRSKNMDTRRIQTRDLSRTKSRTSRLS